MSDLVLTVDAEGFEEDDVEKIIELESEKYASASRKVALQRESEARRRIVGRTEAAAIALVADVGPERALAGDYPGDGEAYGPGDPDRHGGLYLVHYAICRARPDLQPQTIFEHSPPIPGH